MHVQKAAEESADEERRQEGVGAGGDSGGAGETEGECMSGGTEGRVLHREAGNEKQVGAGERDVGGGFGGDVGVLKRRRVSSARGEASSHGTRERDTVERGNERERRRERERDVDEARCSDNDAGAEESKNASGMRGGGSRSGVGGNSAMRAQEIAFATPRMQNEKYAARSGAFNQGARATPCARDDDNSASSAENVQVAASTLVA
jgi:hypothetical protein